MVFKKIFFTISIFGFLTNYSFPSNSPFKQAQSVVKEIMCTTLECNPWGLGMSDTRAMILNRYNLQNPTNKVKPRTDFSTSLSLFESCIIAALIGMCTTNPTATCAQILPYTCAAHTIGTNASLNHELEPIIIDMEKYLNIKPTPCSSLQSRMQDIQEKCNTTYPSILQIKKME